MTQSKQGTFITFEGTEGAGKTTLIQALSARLTQDGFWVVATREPGGSEIAEKIRALILNHPMHAMTELFLYEASRAEHLHQTILPALEKGAVVLCDRFTDSSLAYQGMARGLDWKMIRKLNTIATSGIIPHAKIWVDIDPALGLKNAKNPNRFEEEGVAFQTRVRKGFQKAAREEPKLWIKIKARSGTPDEMADALLQKLKPKLKKKFK